MRLKDRDREEEGGGGERGGRGEGGGGEEGGALNISIQITYREYM